MKIFNTKQNRFYKCERCGSNEFYLEKSDSNKANHLGAYCCDCRKWLKWVSKKDVHLNKKEYELLLSGGSLR